jgi:hypothetical protein
MGRKNMNKKYIFLIAIVATALTTFVTIAQQAETAEFTVTLTTPKANYILGEPIPLTFTLENKTSEPLVLRSSPSFHYENLRVLIEKSTGKPIDTSNLWRAEVPRPFGEHQIPPGRVMTDRKMISEHLREVLSEPGDFRIRATFKNGEATLASEWVTFTISQPTGRDAEAYAYIQGVRDSLPKGFPFNRLEDNQAFLDLFPDTTYADYVRYSLGMFYVSNSDEKARGYEMLRQLETKADFFYADKVKAQLGGGATKPKSPQRRN